MSVMALLAYQQDGQKWTQRIPHKLEIISLLLRPEFVGVCSDISLGYAWFVHGRPDFTSS